MKRIFMMKKRYFKPRPKNLPKGYDSKLEYRLHQEALKYAEHHCHKDDRVRYSIPHTYEYDFLFEHDGKIYLVETKGRFRDSTESRKYLFIRDYLSEWSGGKPCELVLLFENASTPMPFAKNRKDGTKATHGEWARKNGFRWLCEKRGDIEGIDSPEALIRKLEELNC